MRRYRFCPYCGKQIISKYLKQEGKRREVCSACGRVFYYNSRPCVGALIIKDGKVLLVRRIKEPYKGYWDIPGGFLEPGEHPVKGLIREIREETGLKVRPREILGIFMDKYGPESWDTLNIHYVVEIVGGKAQPTSEVKEFKWFSKRNLPKKIAFRNGREALKAWRNMQNKKKKRS